MKSPFYLLLFFSLSSIYSCGQIASVNPSKKFDFEQITFHSSECNGICPVISMNIYKNKTIELSRGIYKSKGNPDTAKSGNFKGQLNEKDYSMLLTLLKQIDWETITFSKVKCCDKPVKTIILSYNKKYKQFKSMEPPQSTLKLIEFLTNLGAQIKLPSYKKPIDFEDVLD
jgi:Fe-S-cluster containining protein